MMFFVFQALAVYVGVAAGCYTAYCLISRKDDKKAEEALAQMSRDIDAFRAEQLNS